jgi:hypothetical protein
VSGRRVATGAAGLALVLAMLWCATGEARAQVRIATFNASLHRGAEGELAADLATGDDPQARGVAAILQRVRPDAVLLQEFDFDAEGVAIARFRSEYLAVPQDGAPPIDYPFVFLAPSNTGVATGVDLDRNGYAFATRDEYERAVREAGLPQALGGAFYGGDAKGFGQFPGRYGMVLLSRFPIHTEDVRTFQNLLWRDMPDARLPVDPSTGEPWYSDAALAVLPLSSKSHWDVPIDVDGRVIHLLCAHPTPPVFDGPEDRNGHRNHDEIRFWLDYVTPGRGAWIVDDRGRSGGLGAGRRFVILGDHNADPVDGDGARGVIRDLSSSPQVAADVTPWSLGAARAALEQGGPNTGHAGSPWFDTGDFDESGPGNLRIDYALPSRCGLLVLDARVFWPLDEAQSTPVSDHHLVWVDLVPFGARNLED